MKKGLIVLTIILTLSACGKGKKEEKTPVKPKQEISVVSKTVRVKKIEKNIVSKNDSSSGIIEPINEVSEISETGGDVVSVHFKNGDRVKKGDIVVQLKNTKIKTTYLTSKANLLSVESNLKTKKINYEKFEKLYKEKLISEDQFLTIENGYKQAESSLLVTRANYEAARENYNDLTMKAKISGVITDLDTKKFAKLNPNTTVFTIVDDSKMKIKTSISPEEITGLKVGDEAHIFPEVFDVNYLGKVSEINPVADPKTKKFHIKVELNNFKKDLKKGMYSKVIITTGSRKGYLVPSKSIVVKSLYSYIFIEKDNKVKQIRVLRGYANGENIEVLSDELKGDFNVVVDGQYLLNDDDSVNIIK